MSDLPQQRQVLITFSEKEVPMATYTLPELRQQWSREELTVEQLLGHQLQHLIILEARLTDLEKRLRQLEQPRPAAGKPQP